MSLMCLNSAKRSRIAQRYRVIGFLLAFVADVVVVMHAHRKCVLYCMSHVDFYNKYMHTNSIYGPMYEMKTE